MNKIYLYDGNYYSLLALIIELIKNKIKPLNIICEKKYEVNLLDETIYLEANLKNNEILKKLPKSIMHTIWYIFLSDSKDKELLIYEFIKLSFKYKEEVFRYRNIDTVNQILKITKYVGSEAHKLKGFLRFKHINSKFYYGEIEPNNNVIYILAHHFKERLNEPWIIHDLKRNIYAIYDLKKVSYFNNIQLKEMALSIDNNELEYEDLWKTFFKTIAIKERKNLKCQMNFMPKRYWNHLLEMEK